MESRFFYFVGFTAFGLVVMRKKDVGLFGCGMVVEFFG